MPKADSWTVTLPWPPSTNRIWRNVAVSGKPRTLLSQEGRVYRKAAADAGSGTDDNSSFHMRKDRTRKAENT